MMRLFCIPLLVLAATAAMAADTAGLGVDALLEKARAEAYAGNRDQARELCREILSRTPGYHDARILLARTYAWDGDYDAARAALHEVLERDPAYRDTYNALIDTETWAGRPQAALDATEQALRYFPNDANLLRRKVRLQQRLERSDAALRTLSAMETIAPNDPAIPDLRTWVNATRARPYSVGGAMSYTSYSRIFDSDRRGYIQGARQTRFGSVIGRVNFARRFEETGYQPEIDFYPSLAEGLYAYLNYGYSDSFLFPDHRFGAELFKSLPRAFEASLGVRHLQFDGGDVTIYTGSIGQYRGNWLFTARPYLTPDTDGLSRSVTLSARRYFATGDDYVTLSGSIGRSPQERRFQAGADRTDTLDSWSVGVDGQWRVAPGWVVFGGLDYGEEELSFAPGEFVNLTTVSAGVYYLF